MSLDELCKLIPPPAEPFEIGNKTKWSKVEKSLGTKLPSDYKDLVDNYGSGAMGGFYNILNPFGAESAGNLLHRFKTYSKTLAEQHDSDPENWPYAPFPQVPGLIPWGNDSNGNTYYWLVKPKTKPDDWTVVLNDCETFEEYAGSMTDYLVAVFKGKVDALAGNFPGEGDFRFVQASPVSPRVKELTEAIKSRDAKKVRELIAAGTDVNAINYTGNTLLYFAAGSSDTLEILKLLVEAGADVNGVSEFGTPLFATVYDWQPENAQYLLSVGADPLVRNHHGDTPLHAALGNQVEPMIKLLATVPGTLDATNKDKLTPLAVAKAIAKKRNRPDLLEMLEAAAGEKPRPAKAAKAVAIPLSMQSLAKLLPPPAVPKDVGTEGRWRMAERQFHTALPADWRDFCTVYGSFGSIGPIGLVIVNPFNKGEWPWIKGRLGWFRREWAKVNDPKLYRYSLFPEAGGLFPFARMDPRIEIFYKTEGNPDAWPIVVWDEESRSWAEHNLTLTGFLTALFQGKAVAPWKKGWIKECGGPLKLE